MAVHVIGNQKAPPTLLSVGDEVYVRSRRKRGWIAKLGGKHPRFGRCRNFLPAESIKRNRYHFKIKTPGEYEVGGMEAYEYRYTFEAK